MNQIVYFSLMFICCLIGVASGIIVKKKLNISFGLRSAIVFYLVAIKFFVYYGILYFPSISEIVSQYYIESAFNGLIIGWSSYTIILFALLIYKERTTHFKL